MEKTRLVMDFLSVVGLAASVLILSHRVSQLHKSYTNQLDVLKIRADRTDRTLNELIREYQSLRMRVFGTPVIDLRERRD